MKRDGLAPEGGLWAVRCKCLPIADEAHFERVISYIRGHTSSGAIVHEIAQFSADKRETEQNSAFARC